ncbi:CopD family protein [Ramlibacter sp. AN1015]|uniref:CopD family protein n=1 Tax=Ramlibacter sp. AN1015 TaxID=3133428 RepID=UPI0030BE1191
MPWLKLLHITAIVLWCGSLLYLPAAIAVAAGPQPAKVVDPDQRGRLRMLFTQVATPAALVAIASGTAIFLLYGPVAQWLIAKLAVVGLLVLGHGMCGMLILRAERASQPHPPRFTRTFCTLVGMGSVLWVGLIAWLVLGKPF